ncbi:hypothetical protein [Flagellimonas halotolerans]|uniref:DUF1064 domain-containing protein n=1 Tax=Flagellimonas halotolerans TaxID=3112164 RepID=A0ABU6ITD9_9FLAO|nr:MULTISPECIES: hypothetical protein [unclassified Allomuricauda]MEC3966471.1 hypothetical protein [Muricauda sp. SYSU M86414]MEC4266392.1 hypothetical protein [Muricauda sp. SYSU M84420]
MKTIDFRLSQQQFENLNNEYPKQGKNSHIGHKAIQIAKYYFNSIYENPKFEDNVDGVDLIVYTPNDRLEYEVKGTEDSGIAFHKLKVSSFNVYDKLMNGLTLLRICSVGNRTVRLHFML